jgi:hypothetical protein
MNTLTMPPINDVLWVRFEAFLTGTLGLVIENRARNSNEWTIIFSTNISAGDQTTIENALSNIQNAVTWS